MISSSVRFCILRSTWLKCLGISYFYFQHSKLSQSIETRWLAFYGYLDRESLSNSFSLERGDQVSDGNLPQKKLGADGHGTFKNGVNILGKQLKVTV